MKALLDAVTAFGLPTVLAVIAVYVLLRGELVFRYPRSK
jgi:hypothetical protein